jgi:hypothetical protein
MFLRNVGLSSMDNTALFRRRQNSLQNAFIHFKTEYFYEFSDVHNY